MTPPSITDLTSPRVYRGGSWSDYGPSWLSAASRVTDEPAIRSNDIGFRCSLRWRVKR